MTYHDCDKGDRIAALSTRFREREFSEDVYRASLFALGLRGSELEEIIANDIPIRDQFGASNVRVAVRQKTARDIATVIESMDPYPPFPPTL